MSSGVTYSTGIQQQTDSYNRISTITDVKSELIWFPLSHRHCSADWDVIIGAACWKIRVCISIGADWHKFMCKHSAVVCCMCKFGDSLQCICERGFLFFLFFSFLLDGLKEKIATFRGTGAKRFSQSLLFPIFVWRDPARALCSLTWGWLHTYSFAATLLQNKSFNSHLTALSGEGLFGVQCARLRHRSIYLN